MAYFHLRLVPPRPTSPLDVTEPDMKAWGMALVEMENAEEAQLLADADPVILAGIGFRFDIAPMPTLILRS
jgi:hypothetical protein